MDYVLPHIHDHVELFYIIVPSCFLHFIWAGAACQLLKDLPCVLKGNA